MQLFLLTPLTLYLGNHGEIGAGLLDVLRICLLPLLATILVFYLINKVSTERWRANWQLILCCLTLLLWLQGQVIVWDYGVLDGNDINWSGSSYRGWVDATVWIVIFAAGLLLGRAHRNLLVSLCCGVLLIQALALTITFMGEFNQIASAQAADQASDKEEIYRFHSDQNVIHIVVDGFQSDVFDFLVAGPQGSNHFRESLSGFTFYRETLGVFPYTRFSIPAYLSGRVFLNGVTKDEFIGEVLSGDNILNQAVNEGFQLDIATAGGYPAAAYSHASSDHFYDIDSHALSRPTYYQAALLIDLSLFRSVPHALKPAIYRDQNWLLSSVFSDGDEMRHGYFRSTVFLHDLINSVTTGRNEPVYKLIHVMNTHNPMVVDANCVYRGRGFGSTRITLTHQSMCTLNTLHALFDSFRNAGIYNDSLIIIHGDHGGWVENTRVGPPIKLPNGEIAPDWIKSLASPLLAIKLPGNQGKLEVSNQLTSLLQLPDSISDIMGWSAKFGFSSILAGEDMQPRSFYFYDWKKDAWTAERTGNILQFEITGSHFESEWTPAELYFPPG